MRRADNIWEKVVDMDNLRNATRIAEKHRRKYRSVISFEQDREQKLASLQASLKDGSYRTSQYRFFDKMEGPKLRHLAALPFYPDRIAQWAVML